VRGLGGGGDVDDVQERVRGRLEPDEARALVEVLGEVRAHLGRWHPLELVALRPVHLREHPVDAAVDVVDGDHAVARGDEVHQRRRRGEPGRVGEAVLGVLERGEAFLQRRPRRVGDARVVVALVPARPLLRERRGLVDRHDDGAGGRVGRLAHVDRARLEVHPLAILGEAAR
jgi:hypothetical protein